MQKPGSQQYGVLTMGALLAVFGSFLVALVTDRLLPVPVQRQQYCFGRDDSRAALLVDLTAGPHLERKVRARGLSSDEVVATEKTATALDAIPSDPAPELAPADTQAAPDLPTARPSTRGLPADPALSAVETLPRDLAAGDEYAKLIERVRSLQGKGKGIAIGLSPHIRPREAAVAAVHIFGSMLRSNGLPVLLVEAAGISSPLAGFVGVQAMAGLHESLTQASAGEGDCIHPTNFDGLWLLPPGGSVTDEGADPVQVRALHKVLADHSLNVIVRLPNGGTSQLVSLMLHSVPDAVVSSRDEQSGQASDPDEVIRRVVDAKNHDFAHRLSLRGSKTRPADGQLPQTVCRKIRSSRGSTCCVSCPPSPDKEAQTGSAKVPRVARL